MNLDPKTIIVINTLGSLFMSIGCFVASYGQLGRLIYVRMWAYGTLVQCLGWIVQGVLRGIIPDIISISFGNALILASIVFYYNILRLFFHQEAYIRTSILFILSEVIVLVLFVSSHYDQKFRVSILSMYASIPLLLSVWEVIKNAKDENFSLYFFAFFCAVAGLFLSFRVYYYFVEDVDPRAITFGPSKIQDFTYLIFYITSIMLTFSFALVCIDRFVKEQVKSEEKYRLLAENSSDLIWLYDLNQDSFRYISPSVQQMYGLSVKKAMRKKLKDMLELKESESFFKLLEERLILFKSNPDSKRYYQDEIQIMHANSEKKWIELISSFQGSTESGIQILGVAREIEKRKQTELENQKYLEDLKTINSTKDRFLSIIAHDLKAPIGGIHTYINMVLEDIHEQSLEKTKEELSLLKDTSSELLSLLNNLLTWARSQKGDIPFDPEHISLFSAANRCIQLLTSSAENKDIEITNQIPIKTVIYADEQMLDTILRNLINNAIKYSHPGNKVIISSEDLDDSLVIHVEDFGMGMNHGTISRLFQLENKQASAPGTRGERGTGLGLVLCKEFILRHQGSISVQSEREIGSRFSVTFPKGN
ncbi:sensor histidine kinase [Leptospira ryugenii]|nr:PAS domain-containing sensor histidine kinase [Leptospira ryugenii]